MGIMASRTCVFKLIKDIYNKIKKNGVSGYLLVSIGLFMVVTSANLDMASHLLKWAETFFSPAHAALYASVAIMILGTIWIYRQQISYRQQIKQRSIHNYDNRDKHELLIYPKFLNPLYLLIEFPFPAKLVCIGVVILTLAGPLDLAWHTAFGIDGLLSPSHTVFRIGEAIAGIGALWGIVTSSRVTNYKPIKNDDIDRTSDMSQVKHKIDKVSVDNSDTSANPVTGGDSTAYLNHYHTLYPLFIVIAVAAVWRTATGFTSMVTLPYSNTINFHWNPDPFLAVVIATICFPFFTSIMLFCSFILGNYNLDDGSRGIRVRLGERRAKFGILTSTAAAYMLITIFTSILPFKFMVPSIPWYTLNIIPIFAVDVLLTVVYANTMSSKNDKTIVRCIAGAVLGLTFITLYYPYIGLTYSELVSPHQFLRLDNIGTYFKTMGEVFPWIIVPSIASGIFGMIVGSKILALKAQQRPIN
jgi:hypothetical protein